MIVSSPIHAVLYHVWTPFVRLLVILLLVVVLTGCASRSASDTSRSVPLAPATTLEPVTSLRMAQATPDTTPTPAATPELIPRAFAPLLTKAAQFRFTLFAPLLLLNADFDPEPPPPGADPDLPLPAPFPVFDPSTTTVRLEPVVAGLIDPTSIVAARDNSGRLFVTQQEGLIRIVRDGAILPDPFLDLTSSVKSEGPEQGLLNIVFHPAYQANGQFYVSYTDEDDNVVVARYTVSSNPDRADPTSGSVLLSVGKPAEEHNGGQLAFGPDGYLYIGLGDGGLQGDPRGNAQATNVLLGKILRIDIDHGTPYAVPPNNPFVGQARYRPEIWALGLRNPWRFAFDRLTGDLYIGDVGQDLYEEVDFQAAGSPGGQNYGWNIAEGGHCYRGHDNCDPAAYTLPVAEYPHTGVCNAVIGGYVYRGQAQPILTGVYFFADACSGEIWSLTHTESGVWTQTTLVDASVVISSFGEDDNGELYVTALDSGQLYHLVATPR